LTAFFTGLAAFFASFFLVAILIYLEHSCAPLLRVISSYLTR
jgi:hypothetical protein